MLTEAIILAGGFGTRLQSVVSDVPKPMAPIQGEPFLNYIFDYLNHYNIKHVVLATGHLSEKISEYYKNAYQGIGICYTNEEHPLGTGGGIRLALESCQQDEVLVLNGDSFFDVDLTGYAEKHRRAHSDCSLALRRVNNAARYGTIELGDQQVIKSFHEKDGLPTPALINGGVYILNRELFLRQTKPHIPFSIEKDFFEKRLNESPIYGFEYEGYFIDIGIPEDYTKAQDEFKGFKYR